MSQRGRGTDRGGYSGRGDRGRDRGGYSPRGDRGGYVPRGDRGGYVPHGDRGGGRGRGGPPPIAINYNSRSFAPVSPDTKAVAIIKPKAVQTKYVTVENLDPNTKLDFVPRPAQPCRIGENIGAITNFFNLKFGSVKVQQFRADIVNFKCKPVELSRNRKIKTMDRVLRRTTSKFDMHNLVYNDGEEIYVPNCKIQDGEFQELIDVDIPSTTDAVEARKADKNPYYVQFKKTVCFEIKLNNCSNTDYKLTLNFLNLFLTQMYRHAPQLGRIVDGEDLDFSRFSAKSNIFFKPYEHVSPEYAIDALRCLYNGVSMSSQLGPRGTAILNVGQVHSIHVRQNLRALDFYCEASGIRSNGVEKYDASSYAQLGMNEMQRKKLHGLLFGLKLTPSYNTDRDFSCCDVPNFNAQTAKVTWLSEKGAVTTSIEQYYLQKYKLPLKYPQLPLIQMNPAAKKIYVPMEYVMVSYRLEQLKKKLDPNQTAVMVTKCTKVPNQKFSEIFDGIEKVQKECEESFKTLDLAIGSQITTVANILPEPRIDANKERNQLAVNKNLPLFSWGIVYASGVDQRMSLLDMKSKAMHIIKETTKYGARFATATPAYEIMNFDTRQDVTTLKKCFDGKIKDGKTHIIIFVISNTTDTECYRKIKMLAEQKEFLGCHSQVITNQVLGKTDPSKPSCRLCQNVAMKIIAKIGGVAKSIIFDNGKLIEIGKLIKCNTDFKKMFFNPADPTIYIGADVIHTSPQDRESDKDRGASIPSIATVVGSVDFDGMKYGVSSRTHSLRDNKDA
uniref:PAZ domain-containing protein n=1 Tax=Rhabditophanes sp. KR3021 TaxID=114890 RepID=A0AC35TID7_9BILA